MCWRCFLVNHKPKIRAPSCMDEMNALKQKCFEAGKGRWKGVSYVTAVPATVKAMSPIAENRESVARVLRCFTIWILYRIIFMFTVNYVTFVIRILVCCVCMFLIIGLRITLYQHILVHCSSSCGSSSRNSYELNLYNCERMAERLRGLA